MRDLLEHGVDGMVLVGRDHAPETLELMKRHRCPFVSTWTFTNDSLHPCVGFDNTFAAHAITDHLLDLGHTRIGVIAGVRIGNDRARERVSGVQAALSARGLGLDPINLIERPYEISEGRNGFKTLMAVASEKRASAIFCGNDVLAIGAVLEAQNMGLSVPDDISIVGFDDLPLAAHPSPRIDDCSCPGRDGWVKPQQNIYCKLLMAKRWIPEPSCQPSWLSVIQRRHHLEII